MIILRSFLTEISEEDSIEIKSAAPHYGKRDISWERILKLLGQSFQI
jgi:hypothetical protein